MREKRGEKPEVTKSPTRKSGKWRRRTEVCDCLHLGWGLPSDTCLDADVCCFLPPHKLFKTYSILQSSEY